MFLSETLQEKWQPVLEHVDLPEIKDGFTEEFCNNCHTRKPRKSLKEDAAFLGEVAPTNATGSGYCELGSNSNYPC